MKSEFGKFATVAVLALSCAVVGLMIDRLLESNSHLDSAFLVSAAAVLISTSSLLLTLRDRNKELRVEFAKRRVQALYDIAHNMSVRLMIAQISAKHFDDPNNQWYVDASNQLIDRILENENAALVSLQLYGTEPENLITGEFVVVSQSVVNTIEAHRVTGVKPDEKDYFARYDKMASIMFKFTSLAREAAGVDRLTNEVAELIGAGISRPKGRVTAPQKKQGK